MSADVSKLLRGLADRKIFNGLHGSCSPGPRLSAWMRKNSWPGISLRCQALDSRMHTATYSLRGKNDLPGSPSTLQHTRSPRPNLDPASLYFGDGCTQCAQAPKIYLQTSVEIVEFVRFGSTPLPPPHKEKAVWRGLRNSSCFRENGWCTVPPQISLLNLRCRNKIWILLSEIKSGLALPTHIPLHGITNTNSIRSKVKYTGVMWRFRKLNNLWCQNNNETTSKPWVAFCSKNRCLSSKFQTSVCIVQHARLRRYLVHVVLQAFRGA